MKSIIIVIIALSSLGYAQRYSTGGVGDGKLITTSVEVDSAETITTNWFSFDGESFDSLYVGVLFEADTALVSITTTLEGTFDASNSDSAYTVDTILSSSTSTILQYDGVTFTRRFPYYRLKHVATAGTHDVETTANVWIWKEN